MSIPSEIKLSRGLIAKVDPEDLAELSRYKWHAANLNGRFYAARNAVRDGRPVMILMHRLLLVTKPGELTDHINGDSLDNRKANLRPCTHQQNMQNTKRRINSSSRFKGTFFDKALGKWRAAITASGVKRHLGVFSSDIAAAQAYDAAARLHFGEFARCNFPAGGAR